MSIMGLHLNRRRLSHGLCQIATVSPAAQCQILTVLHSGVSTRVQSTVSLLGMQPLNHVEDEDLSDQHMLETSFFRLKGDLDSQ